MTEPDPTTDPVEDDHDLLSYTLAGERLAEAVTALRAELAALPALPGTPDPAVAEPLGRRLEALVGALARHDGPAITAVNRSFFYGWTDVAPPQS